MTYLVKLKPGKTREHISSVCTKVGRPRALHELVLVEVDDPETLAKHPCVESIEDADQQVKPAEVDVIPHTLSWHLPRVSQTQNPRRYKSARSGAGVLIYVVDDGLNTTHPEMSGKSEVIYSFDGQDYDSSGAHAQHGMLAASLAAGKTVGTAPGAEVKFCRTSWNHGSVVKCIDSAVSHYLQQDRPGILNLSLIGVGTSMHHACNAARAAGMVVVAAAGNDARDTIHAAPANHSAVIAVGASTQHNTPASYTNFGSLVDVFGWGHSVRCASLTSYRLGSGTSSAAPIVAGILAQLLQGSDQLPNEVHVQRVQNWIRATSRPEVNLGSGYPNTTNRVPTLAFPSGTFYGHTDETLYQQVTAAYNRFGQIPDVQGLAYWHDIIKSGQGSVADLEYVLWVNSQ